MSILYFDFLCFSCYCSIKNAQINGTLGIMWEMFIGETTNVMYAGRIAEVGHPGDHVKTVHEEIFINYVLIFL